MFIKSTVGRDDASMILKSTGITDMQTAFEMF